jgi:hypothetical protein
MKERGLPVSDVFDQEIKDLPTTRFSKDFNDDYKLLHAEIKRDRELKGSGDIRSKKSNNLDLQHD